MPDRSEGESTNQSANIEGELHRTALQLLGLVTHVTAASTGDANQPISAR
jgi:hypothetical protein